MVDNRFDSKPKETTMVDEDGFVHSQTGERGVQPSPERKLPGPNVQGAQGISPPSGTGTSSHLCQ
eukprot:8227382-Prorocentrum_lima.AAC.1